MNVLQDINIKTYSNVIDDDLDNFIGFKSDLIDKFRYELVYLLSIDDFVALENVAPDTIELLRNLSAYDDSELLKVSYHPMGAYYIKKMEV